MQGNKFPLVTIGIPTYNRGNLLQQTIRSALAQDYPNLEIIIADNASTDYTYEICKFYRDHHINLRYYRQISNIGPTENFRTLLNKANGSYFMWLGDDDWIDKNYITECVKILSFNSEASVVSGQVKYYGINDHFLYTGIGMNFLSENKKKRVSEYFSKVKHNGLFYGVISKDLIIRCGFKNLMGGDLLLIASLLFIGKGYTQETCSLHRRRGGVSSDSKKMAKDISSNWLDYYYPRISVAKNVFQHIMFDPIFNELSLSSRFFLAAQCITKAFLRKVLSVLFKKKFVEQDSHSTPLSP